MKRAAVRCLRAGVVPPWELEALSVGYEQPTKIVHRALDALRTGERSTPMFVRGEWGTGKTHFLSFVRAAARTRGVASTFISLNGRSAALNHPQRFYTALCGSLCVNHTAPGLASLLLDLLADDEKRAQLRNFANGNMAGELGPPLRALCWAYEHGNRLMLADQPAWRVILGGDLGWADYTYKREQAISRIATLGDLCAAVTGHGLVLLFDEVETIDQLWNVRSRLSAYGVLGRICRLPTVWPIFGVTERFERALGGDVSRGVLTYDFVTENARWFLQSWSKGTLHTVDAPVVDQHAALALAKEVRTLYEGAYGTQPPYEEQARQAVGEWLRNPSRNPRRLIRLVVHRLDLCRPV